MGGEIGRVKTYIGGMDKHLEGGVPEGSVVLICGTPGTMKSSLAYSILYNNAKEGRKGIYITLEQDSASLTKQMEKLHMGPHDGLTLVDFDALGWRMKDARYEANWVERMKDYIEEMAKKEEYKLLALDSLNALYSLTTVQNPRRELYYLFKALQDTGMTSFLISEIALGTKYFGHFGVEEFLADGIIHLDFQKKGDILSSLERYIGIIKMRATNHETMYYPLLYLEDGFRVYSREELELE
ncbi:MAG: AAA family ATPase [Euryarchaeota archaeon]|nr:AAA family ATPase [Euryarchaeota archaeon]